LVKICQGSSNMLATYYI